MPCEFSKIRINCLDVVCNKMYALKNQINKDGLEEAYTPVTLKKELCDSNNPQTWEQCDAHADLQKYGRASVYSK